MARKSKKDKQDEAPQTEARKTFDANITPISALIKKIHPKELTRAGKSMKRAAEKFIETKDEKYIRALARAGAAFSKATDHWLGLRRLSYESMSVMLVVFLEA